MSVCESNNARLTTNWVLIHLLAIASHYSGGKRKTRSLEQQNQDANFDSQKEKTKIANLDLDFDLNLNLNLIDLKCLYFKSIQFIIYFKSKHFKDLESLVEFSNPNHLPFKTFQTSYLNLNNLNLNPNT